MLALPVACWRVARVGVKPESCVSRILFVLLAFVALSAPLAAQRNAVVATYAYTKYDRAAALQPLADALTGALGEPVEVRVLDTPRALAAALRAGEVDVAVTNTFVHLATRSDPRVRALGVFDVPARTLDGYRGVLLARRDGIATLDGIRTAAQPVRYAQAIPGSTSGGMVQDLFLAANGIDVPAKTAIHYAGSHEAALTDLLHGGADIAALTDAAWQRARADAADVVELWRSPPIPPGPVVCRRDGRIDCARAQRFLLEIHTHAPPALAALVGGWSEAAGATRIVVPDDDAYDALTAGFASEDAARAVLERMLER